MKVLVTGGAGFIGSHLVDAYLARGDSVVVVDDFSAGKEMNLASAVKQGVRVHRMSLLDTEFSEWFLEENFDLISHHAAQKSVRTSVEHPRVDAEINILGLLRLMEAARKSSCRHVVFASSGGAIYGEQREFPANELHSIRPISPYGVSKYASELYLQYYSSAWNFHCTALRYSNVFGPRQDPEGEAGVVAIFCDRMQQGLRSSIYGSGQQTRDFVFVKDVVSAHLLAGDSAKGFQYFNVASSRETSILELYSLLRSLANQSFEPQMGPARPGEQLRSLLSTQKIEKAMGWKSHTSLEKGLRETLDSFRLSKG